MECIILTGNTNRRQKVRKPGTIFLVAGMVLLLVIHAACSNRVMRENSVQLSIQEKAFLDMMLEEWNHDFRLTTIRQIADNEGFEYDHDLRYRIATYLVNHESIHRQLQVWRSPLFILTNDEKVLANYILKNAAVGENIPAVEEMKKALSMDEESIEEALFILQKLGFLHHEKLLKIFPGEYTLNPEHEEMVPWWSLYFTEIEREDGRRFNFQCVLDAMKLIFEDFTGEKVKITTYCPDCLRSIQVETDNGEITDIKPRTSVALKGGSCPTTYIFVTSGHFKRWIDDRPEIVDRKPYNLINLFELIKEER